jgi:hypothetical protein
MANVAITSTQLGRDVEAISRAACADNGVDYESFISALFSTPVNAERIRSNLKTVADKIDEDCLKLARVAQSMQ